MAADVNDHGGTRPPGWYPDPEGRYSHLAYWDGEGWTGEIRPSPQDGKPWHQSGALLVGGGVLLIVMAAAVGGEGFVVVVLAVFALASGFASQYVASAKGYVDTWYFWLGFFLPIVGILVAVGMPQRDPPAFQETPRSKSTAGTDLSSQIAELSRLHETGVLTEDEFRAAKRKLLDPEA